jgi:hypothetical protein
MIIDGKIVMITEHAIVPGVPAPDATALNESDPGAAVAVVAGVQTMWKIRNQLIRTATIAKILTTIILLPTVTIATIVAVAGMAIIIMATMVTKTTTGTAGFITRMVAVQLPVGTAATVLLATTMAAEAADNIMSGTNSLTAMAIETSTTSVDFKNRPIFPMQDNLHYCVVHGQTTSFVNILIPRF